jgi:hypothetical protein
MYRSIRKHPLPIVGRSTRLTCRQTVLSNRRISRAITQLGFRVAPPLSLWHRGGRRLGNRIEECSAPARRCPEGLDIREVFRAQILYSLLTSSEQIGVGSERSLAGGEVVRRQPNKREPDDDRSCRYCFIATLSVQWVESPFRRAEFAGTKPGFGALNFVRGLAKDRQMCKIPALRFTTGSQRLFEMRLPIIGEHDGSKEAGGAL